MEIVSVSINYISSLFTIIVIQKNKFYNTFTYTYIGLHFVIGYDNIVYDILYDIINAFKRNHIADYKIKLVTTYIKNAILILMQLHSNHISGFF